MSTMIKTFAVVVLAISVLFIALPASANTTITDEVSDSNEIIAKDGTIYNIAETEKGEELAEMVGEVVNVTGTVQEAEGEKTITVDSFTKVAE